MVFQHLRYVYFFGYGADREVDMIRAITGRKPKVVGAAILKGYELYVQPLECITNSKKNDLRPRELLRRTWGNEFTSYVIVPNSNESVCGTLFRISLHDRHLIDNWELVSLGWYDKLFTEVERDNGKKYRCETQVLAPGQQPGRRVDGIDYRPWLVPKERLMEIASNVRVGIHA